MSLPGGFDKGDVLGVLLKVDGTLLFTKNGKQHGPGYVGVTGEVVPAVQLGTENTSVRLNVDAELPRWAVLPPAQSSQ